MFQNRILKVYLRGALITLSIYSSLGAYATYNDAVGKIPNIKYPKNKIDILTEYATSIIIPGAVISAFWPLSLPLFANITQTSGIWLIWLFLIVLP